jgi:dihydroorotate dehydrogenase
MLGLCRAVLFSCLFMATLATTVDGLNLPNPFLIAAGPPGTNLNVIQRAFREKWGGVIAKTISLDASKVVNVTPRYGKLYSSDRSEIFGWENIELISDRPFEIWLEEFKRCKDQNPGGVLIASIMEEYRRDAWIEIVERCQEAGVDGFELNFSCPHGLPERKMGSAMGEDSDILREVCGWVMDVARKPVWAKITQTSHTSKSLHARHFKPAVRELAPSTPFAASSV